MNYTLWLNLLALSVQLMSADHLPADMRVTHTWVSLNDFSIVSTEYQDGLRLDFFHDQDQYPLVSYLLVPWQDFTMKLEKEELPGLMHGFIFVGVHRFGLVYQLQVFSEGTEDDGLKKSLQDRTEDLMLRHLGLQNWRDQVTTSESITMLEALQVIRVNQYQQMVDIQIALPGSDLSKLAGLKDEFPGKMLQVFVVPDMGVVEMRWMKGKDGSDQNACIEQENELSAFLGAEDPDLRLLVNQYFSSGMVTSFDTPMDMFPDYEPKLTPDLAIDFRPALLDLYQDIPLAKLNHLKDLLRAYRKHRRIAKRNPGRWEAGNMVLGAKEQEFIPSDAAFLLEEIADRIEQVIRQNDQKDIQKALRGMWCKPRNIEYTSFTITHSDVMGSGRFFYIDTMNQRSFRFN